MKTRPENDLLNDIFSTTRDFRAESLAQTLVFARQQRRRRKGFRVSIIATFYFGLLLALNSKINLHQPSSPVAMNPAPSTKPNFSTVPGTSIRILNDEELLKLFANRPVAFFGPPENRQFIVLDEVDEIKMQTQSAQTL
jgi:hypothetical protein